MAIRCLTCGGVYERELPDGSQYFHVCPPLTMVQVLRGGQRQVVPITDLRPDDSIRVQTPTGRATILVANQGADDHRLGDTTAERANKRDERPVQRLRRGELVTVPTAEGAGVETVAVDVAAPVDVFADPGAPSP